MHGRLKLQYISTSFQMLGVKSLVIIKQASENPVSRRNPLEAISQLFPLFQNSTFLPSILSLHDVASVEEKERDGRTDGDFFGLPSVSQSVSALSSPSPRHQQNQKPRS